MRTWLPVICILLPVLAWGQIEKRMNIQQSPIQMPVQAPVSCYEERVEQGQVAYRAGNCGLALQYFREALLCPELRRDPGLQQELKRMADRCEEKSAQTKPLRLSIDSDREADARARGKGRYAPARAFLENADPNCYDLTRREADRAFAGGYWEDAAALYRAAKSCADADQNERQAMNERIEQCRLSAEKELLEKEQEAVRQARQAIAANRADDARSMLQAADRTAAFRLADFANEYIAPPGENNPDCQQVLFDAWYYDPTSFSSGSGSYYVPFGYQVRENLGAQVQIRFAGSGSDARVFAFAPEHHVVYSWDLTTLKPDRTFAVDTSFRQFDVYPDGRTFLFISDDGFTLWRSAYENYQIRVWDNTRYALDKKGGEFHYYDAQQQSLLSVRLADVFAMSKGYYQKQVETARVRIRGIDPGLLGFTLNYPDVWLAYADSVVVLRKERQDAAWSRTGIWRLSEPVPGGFDYRLPQVLIAPEEKIVTYFNDTAIWPIRLDGPEGVVLSPGQPSHGRLLGAGEDKIRMALWETEADIPGSYLRIRDLNDEQVQFRALCPPEDSYLGGVGAISPDGNWFGSCTTDGTFKLWWLTRSNHAERRELPQDGEVQISPDARTSVVWQQDQISVYDLTLAGGPLRSLQLPSSGPADMLMGNQYLAFYLMSDSLMLWHWASGQLRVLPAFLENAFLPDVVALDEERNRVALRLGVDSVGIYDLNTDKIVAIKAFEGRVEKIYAIPATGDFLVIPSVTAGQQLQSKLIPRIWSPGSNRADRRIVPLQEAAIYSLVLAVSPDGQKIALCEDGAAIQIFADDDLREEFLRIRPLGDYTVAAMAFHPDGYTLAVGYMNGAVVFWDTRDGRIRFQFNPIFGSDDAQIKSLRISTDGKMLRYLNYENVLVGRLLEPLAIRNLAQDANRQLVALLPEQIRDFDLAPALEYPGNFEKLAKSGDLPMIRAFFDYYQQEALGGNNIKRLSLHCDRAFRLYTALDAPTQEVLRATMLDMYIDFHWKLLLRNNLEDAERVVEHIRLHFDNPLSGRLPAAHTALLQGKLRAAATLYTDWVMEAARQEDYYDLPELEALPLQFRQFAEYGLLGSDQQACICTVLGSVVDLEGVCPDSDRQAAIDRYLDPRPSVRWDVFTALFGSGGIPRFSERVAVLTQARETALRLNPGREDRLTDDVTFGLAANYAAWAFFEQFAPRAFLYYEAAIDLMEKGTRDPRRLIRLAEYWSALGTLHYQADALDSAWYGYSRALEYANQAKASGAVPDANLFENDYVAPIRTQMGLIALLQNKIPLAREQFSIANNAMTFGLNGLYLGHADLLERQTEMAFINYGGMYNIDQLGMSLAFLDRLAGNMPDRRDELSEFRDTLRRYVALARNLDTAAVDYMRAQQHIDLCGAQGKWKDALHWSSIALETAQTRLNTGTAGPEWADFWLNALLNQSYYQLFAGIGDTAAFARSIRYVEQAETYVARQYPYYRYRHYFKTNLGHAYWLRGQPGDRDAALEQYRAFLENAQNVWTGGLEADPWETLEKDFRDLIRAGIQWPDMEALLQQIAPALRLSPTDREALGLPRNPNR